jgi:hypothetical protein
MVESRTYSGHCIRWPLCAKTHSSDIYQVLHCRTYASASFKKLEEFNYFILLNVRKKEDVGLLLRYWIAGGYNGYIRPVKLPGNGSRRLEPTDSQLVRECETELYMRPPRENKFCDDGAEMLPCETRASRRRADLHFFSGLSHASYIYTSPLTTQRLIGDSARGGWGRCSDG